jgi:hypothetical protein
VAGDLALVRVPITTEVAGSVTRERYRNDRGSAGCALDLRSQRVDLGGQRAPLRFLLSDAAEQMSLVSLRQTRAIAEDIGPKAAADAEGGKQAKP